MVTTMDIKINSTKNEMVNICSTFTETGFLRMPSIIKNTNFPPSNAGMGNKLNMAKSTEIDPIKYKKNPGPYSTARDKKMVIPTGPANSAPAGSPLPENKLDTTL